MNTLTVIATESYEAFAENLQKEIEKDASIWFRNRGGTQFAAIEVKSMGEDLLHSFMRSRRSFGTF